MARPEKIAEFPAQEYLNWENLQKEKHEYFRGEVFAMVGATRKHVTLAGNSFTSLANHLRGTPCRPYMSAMKLHIESANAFFYPDVLVSCDSADHAAETYLTAPILVIEVLSASTEAYDRGEKFAAYRQIPSLKEYVLADPENRTVEIYRRDDSGRWYLSEPDDRQFFRMESVDLRVRLGELFENV